MFSKLYVFVFALALFAATTRALTLEKQTVRTRGQGINDPGYSWTVKWWQAYPQGDKGAYQYYFIISAPSHTHGFFQDFVAICQGTGPTIQFNACIQFKWFLFPARPQPRPDDVPLNKIRNIKTRCPEISARLSQTGDERVTLQVRMNFYGYRSGQRPIEIYYHSYLAQAIVDHSPVGVQLSKRPRFEIRPSSVDDVLYSNRDING